MRVALYARYSSDLQNPRSVDDQIRESQEHCQRRGWTVVSTYTDPETSGSTIILRPGVQALMMAAAERKFDIVLVEALDRFSRDLGDTANLRKQLNFHQIALHTLSGEVSLMHVAFDGARNEMFIDDLRVKIRRGQRGSVVQGFIPGGLAYGYRVVRKFGDDGELVRGLREIDADKAAVIRRIFRDYIAGMPAIEIATALNKEGIPSPANARRPDSKWNVSTIMGHRKRKYGILQNELYIGRYAYNRQRMIKNPLTGRRVPVTNPPDQWTWGEFPDLRIVDDITWRAAQQRIASAPASGEKATFNRTPKHLLSGLTRCGHCHGAYTGISLNRLGCVAHFNTGMCDNGRTIVMPKVQGAVIAMLRTVLEDEGAVERFGRKMQEAQQRRADEHRRSTADVSKRLADVRARSRAIMEAIEAGGRSAGALVARLADLEGEEAALQASAAAPAPPAPRQLPANFRHLYMLKLDNLEEALTRDSTKRQASAAIRGAIKRIVLTPLPLRGNFEIEVLFDLIGVVRITTPIGSRTFSLVAGEGFPAESTLSVKAVVGMK